MNAKLIVIRAALFSASFLASFLSHSLDFQASEVVVLKVILNTDDMGDYFMRLTRGWDVLVRRKDFMHLGFREITPSSERSIDHEKYVSLKSLSPLITFDIDKRESTIHIAANPTLLETHSINLGYNGPADVHYARQTAAFINYHVDYSAWDGFDSTALNVPWEAGLSVNGNLAFSSFAYTKADENTNFVRLLSNVTSDDTTTLRRVIFGDFSAFSGTLGGGGTLGGLSISRDFAIKPNFRRFPGLDFSGVLETPSEVELYVNDQLISREHVPSGPIQFMNLPGVTGAGDATLVIKDAFGRETRLEYPFYYTTQLLKSGLNDYSYNVGFKRKELGEKSFSYGDPAIVGYHRYGFTSSFTAGLRGEADPQLINLGGLATFVPWRLGEINASLAVSSHKNRPGYGSYLSYSHTNGHVSGGFSASGFSREYDNLGVASRRPPRFGGNVRLGFNQRSFGSISSSYSVVNYYGAPDERRTSLFYSRNLGRNTALQLRADRTQWYNTNNEISAALIIFLGGGKSGSLTYQMQDDRATQIASIQQNPPLGPGLGYRFLLAHSGDDRYDSEFEGDAAARYSGPYGIYSANVSRISGQDIYDVSASGGLAFINNSSYLTRPISDSFALVKVGDLQNVKVNYSNQEAGTTNRHGEVVVPELISYYDNDLSIEAKDIPVNYEIKSTRTYVAPPMRGGSIVEFSVRKLQGFTGRLYIMENGEKVAAQYWGLRIRVADQSKVFTVGRNGEFYLENIPAGAYPATLFWKNRECNLDLTIPNSSEMMIDMGDLTCELH